MNLPAVEEDEAGEVPEDGNPPAVGADIPEIPVLHTEQDVADYDQSANDDESAGDIADVETVLPAETGLEPIQATEWPDPEQGDTVVQVLDADAADDEADTEEDADASLTGA